MQGNGDASLFPGGSLFMARYWYKVELARGVTIEERKLLKSDLRRLFRSAETPIGEGLTFEVTSALEPLDAEAALARLAEKYGKASMTGGSKLE
jgi:hypothetical protein